MKTIWLSTAAFLALMPNALAEWDIGGHAKDQLSFRLFAPGEAGRFLIGRGAYLNTVDLRLNSLYRHGAWDVTAQGQFFILQGNLLKARDDPRLGEFGSSLFALPDPSDSKQVFDLSWTLSEGGSHLLFSRMDRLSLGFTEGPLSVRMGRQVSTWGNGLVFQVMDLFNPFPPNAVDTEYKPGTDMLTAQWLFSNGDDLQAVFVPRRSDRGQPLSAAESSVAVKWRHFSSAVQLELLGAQHYGDAIAGLGMTGNLAGGVWRCDVTETFTDDRDAVTSLLVNIDRSWVVTGRNLYGFVEYFRNGFGSTSLEGGVEMLDLRILKRLGRGELFNLGRHELAGGIRFEWTALTTLEPTLLVNLTDASAYLLFRLHYNWRQNLALDAGIQVGLGGRNTEYGGVYSTELDGYLAPGRAAWLRVAQYF